MESRRRFFEDYARENNFDPTNPEDWYSHAQSLMSRPVRREERRGGREREEERERRVRGIRVYSNLT